MDAVPESVLEVVGFGRGLPDDPLLPAFLTRLAEYDAGAIDLLDRSTRQFVLSFSRQHAAENPVIAQLLQNTQLRPQRPDFISGPASVSIHTDGVIWVEIFGEFHGTENDRTF